MARASNAEGEDLYIPAHDGAILILRRFRGGSARAALIVPDNGERIADPFYRDLAHALCDAQTTSYLLELRGHGVSEGKWSLRNHHVDIAHILAVVAKAFPQLYVIAHGWSASVVLERERHGHPGAGMVLLEPRAQAGVQPLRVQTPTIIFSSDARRVLAHNTGTVHVRAGWHAPQTAAERAHRITAVKDALEEVARHERPIRFATRR